ncbi:MAG: nucleotidyltransferase [Parcubacteria group bacterium Gr01-1014_31]|nr:MAG: nucleotidyltransferase [Parcubacteria group bacterium Gr01-1014_31]
MYGYDASKLEQFITAPREQPADFGVQRDIVATPHYSMRQFALKAGGVLPPRQHERPVTLYVETGVVSVISGTGEVSVPAGKLIEIPAGNTYAVEAKAPSVVYSFAYPNHSGERILKERGGKSAPLTTQEPADRREKYWGDICTIASEEVAGKRLFLKAGSHGSMEFHVRKHESYYVHSGELALLLRAGRAENRLFRVPAGKAVAMPPGLMHQRGAILDTVLLEISTRDEDSDSFLVEDGAVSPMKGFNELIKELSI